MKNYEAVMGIEIHAELKTNTKMFSGSPSTYGETPNTAINEIDLAYPGTMPQVNKEAIRFGHRLARALNCQIEPVLRFDRKNYFYSDLPKGYQITQEYYPLGTKGNFKIYVGEEAMNVRIHRIHLEEDTAKQFHESDHTLIDFNRAGTPLVEIVTEADFRNGTQAASYVDAMRQLVIYLGVGDGKMAEGSLRCDVNISLREVGTDVFGTKVEIKNLNSISNVEKAIEYEIERQTDLLNQGISIVSETRRFDEKTQSTVLMRQKDGVIDYRYLPDALIPPTAIPEEILSEVPLETPFDRLNRYKTDYGLSHYDGTVLIRNKEVSDYFDAVMKETDNTKLVLNWLTQELLSVIDQKGNQSLTTWIPVGHFLDFTKAIESKEISTRQAKEVFDEMLKGKSPKAIIKDKGMVQIGDEQTITTWITQVLEENPRAIEDHRNGLPSAVKFVTGQVMRLSRGQANPQFTNKLVKELLDKAI